MCLSAELSTCVCLNITTTALFMSVSSSGKLLLLFSRWQHKKVGKRGLDLLGNDVGNADLYKCSCTVICLVQGSELIMAYDEHTLTHCFKFGVIYQKFGQVCACQEMECGVSM